MHSNGYNKATVLTNIPIKDNQLFEVELLEMMDQWIGSLTIGFTTHAPSKIKFPSKMTFMTSGTWMIREREVKHCGKKIKGLRYDVDSLVVSRFVYSGMCITNRNV